MGAFISRAKVATSAAKKETSAEFQAGRNELRRTRALIAELEKECENFKRAGHEYGLARSKYSASLQRICEAKHMNELLGDKAVEKLLEAQAGVGGVMEAMAPGVALVQPLKDHLLPAIEHARALKSETYSAIVDRNALAEKIDSLGSSKRMDSVMKAALAQSEHTNSAARFAALQAETTDAMLAVENNFRAILAAALTKNSVAEADALTWVADGLRSAALSAQAKLDALPPGAVSRDILASISASAAASAGSGTSTIAHGPSSGAAASAALGEGALSSVRLASAQNRISPTSSDNASPRISPFGNGGSGDAALGRSTSVGRWAPSAADGGSGGGSSRLDASSRDSPPDSGVSDRATRMRALITSSALHGSGAPVSRGLVDVAVSPSSSSSSPVPLASHPPSAHGTTSGVSVSSDSWGGGGGGGMPPQSPSSSSITRIASNSFPLTSGSSSSSGGGGGQPTASTGGGLRRLPMYMAAKDVPMLPGETSTARAEGVVHDASGEVGLVVTTNYRLRWFPAVHVGVVEGSVGDGASVAGVTTVREWGNTPAGVRAASPALTSALQQQSGAAASGSSSPPRSSSSSSSTAVVQSSAAATNGPAAPGVPALARAASFFDLAAEPSLVGVGKTASRSLKQQQLKGQHHDVRTNLQLARAPSPFLSAQTAAADASSTKLVVFSSNPPSSASPLSAAMGGGDDDDTAAAATSDVIYGESGGSGAAVGHYHRVQWCLSLPLLCVSRIEVVGGPRGSLVVAASDFRVMSFGFSLAAGSDAMGVQAALAEHTWVPAPAFHLKYTLDYLAPPRATNFLHLEEQSTAAGGGAPSNFNLSGGGAGAVDGWSLFTFSSEWQRLCAMSPAETRGLWRVSAANRSYALCATYPEFMIMPSALSDAAIAAASRFRSKRRLPAVTWFHGSVSLSRASQPLAGMFNSRSSDDERLVVALAAIPSDRAVISAAATTLALRSSYPAFGLSRADDGSQAALAVFDARPRLNALGNRTKGGGSEAIAYYPGCSLTFLGIDNIHVVRDALKQLRARLQSDRSRTLHRTMEAMAAASSYADLGALAAAAHQTTQSGAMAGSRVHRAPATPSLTPVASMLALVDAANSSGGGSGGSSGSSSYRNGGPPLQLSVVAEAAERVDAERLLLAAVEGIAEVQDEEDADASPPLPTSSSRASGASAAWKEEASATHTRYSSSTGGPGTRLSDGAGRSSSRGTVEGGVGAPGSPASSGSRSPRSGSISDAAAAIGVAEGGVLAAARKLEAAALAKRAAAAAAALPRTTSSVSIIADGDGAAAVPRGRLSRGSSVEGASPPIKALGLSPRLASLSNIMQLAAQLQAQSTTAHKPSGESPSESSVRPLDPSMDDSLGALLGEDSVGSTAVFYNAHAGEDGTDDVEIFAGDGSSAPVSAASVDNPYSMSTGARAVSAASAMGLDNGRLSGSMLSSPSPMQLGESRGGGGGSPYPFSSSGGGRIAASAPPFLQLTSTAASSATTSAAAAAQMTPTTDSAGALPQPPPSPSSSPSAVTRTVSSPTTGPRTGGPGTSSSTGSAAAPPPGGRQGLLRNLARSLTGMSGGVVSTAGGGGIDVSGSPRLSGSFVAASPIGAAGEEGAGTAAAPPAAKHSFSEWASQRLGGRKGASSLSSSTATSSSSSSSGSAGVGSQARGGGGSGALLKGAGSTTGDSIGGVDLPIDRVVAGPGLLWLRLVSILLRGGVACARHLGAGVSVFVHCRYVLCESVCDGFLCFSVMGSGLLLLLTGECQFAISWVRRTLFVRATRRLLAFWWCSQPYRDSAAQLTHNLLICLFLCPCAMMRSRAATAGTAPPVSPPSHSCSWTPSTARCPASPSSSRRSGARSGTDSLSAAERAAAGTTAPRTTTTSVRPSSCSGSTRCGRCGGSTPRPSSSTSACSWASRNTHIRGDSARFYSTARGTARRRASRTNPCPSGRTCCTRPNGTGSLTPRMCLRPVWRCPPMRQTSS